MVTFLKKLWNKIIFRFKKLFKHSSIDEFATSAFTFDSSRLHNKAKQTFKKKYDGYKHLIDLLPPTEYDFSLQNKQKALIYQKKITECLRKHNINFFNSDIRCNPCFLEIIFSIFPKDIQKVINLQKYFLEIFKNHELNFSIKNNVIGFQLPPYHFSLLTLHKFFKMLPSVNPYDMAVGVTSDRQTPIKQNLHNIKNVLLIGKKNSGSATALVTMLLSLMFTSYEQGLDLFFIGNKLDPIYEEIRYCKLFHSKMVTNLAKIKTFLKETSQEVDQLKKDFKARNNKIKNKPRILVFPRFELLFNKNDKSYAYLLNILKYGPQFKIYCFMQTRLASDLVISNSFLKNISHLYLFKIDDAEASNKLIGSERAIYLYDWGDCLAMTNPLLQDYKHIITCYITRFELNYNLNVLNIFYAQKRKKSK